MQTPDDIRLALARCRRAYRADDVTRARRAHLNGIIVALAWALDDSRIAAAQLPATLDEWEPDRARG